LSSWYTNSIFPDLSPPFDLFFIIFRNYLITYYNKICQNTMTI